MADAVFRVQLLAEVHQAFGHPLDVVYNYLNAAFGLADRATL